MFKSKHTVREVCFTRLQMVVQLL